MRGVLFTHCPPIKGLLTGGPPPPPLSSNPPSEMWTLVCVIIQLLHCAMTAKNRQIELNHLLMAPRYWGGYGAEEGR